MIDSTEDIEKYADVMSDIQRQIEKVIVGQQKTVEQLLWCLFAGGHALLEGIPGLGKTMLVKTIADTMDMRFSRVQFTPDLMPADITGTDIIQFNEHGSASYRFQPGPIFGHIVLADEINRATPKTQSALLEAMQEKTVTIGASSHQLPTPFFVLATQNPIENEGTYPLPEAQLDRFLLKILISYPNQQELKEIVRRTTASHVPMAEKTTDAATVEQVQQAAKTILVSEEVLDFAVKLLLMTHPQEAGSPEEIKRYVLYGSGPRGIQSLISVAKVRALFHRRLQVSLHDLKEVALPVLRHRICLNFDGEAAGQSSDQLIGLILHELEKKA